MATDSDRMLDEGNYDRLRARQWLAGAARGDGLSRRTLLQVSAGAGLAALAGLGRPGRASADPVPTSADPVPASADLAAPADSPIVKPLPPDLFYVYGTNAEMRWEAMRDQGELVPIDRFFVRDHTRTPLIDADAWRLRVFGAGLRGAPTVDQAVEFSYRDLRRMPAETITATVECAGNGRSFFTTQQNQTVSGTAWKLGAVGVARWRGVRLATVLARAGLTADAVDVMPQGLDPDWVNAGVNNGPVRRPLPIQKALHDVLLAYEMNGEPLPPDHGFPVRLIVPSWIGISSIKWLGQIEVADTPLVSPWNTQFYRLFGPGYPTDGMVITRQVTKSAFELPWDATVPIGERQLLRGRSWSGNGAIGKVEVSTDGGTVWRRALPIGPHRQHGWQRWEIPWRPDTAGAYTLRARATDVTGRAQPTQTPFNTLGYLFDAVVAHPVTAA